MINKLGDDLDSAITFAGGDTSSVTNIMQYPEIIRQQLSSSGVNLNSSIILEGDSCVIKSDEDGRDHFNTEYASGIKTGLNPETYYVRICTAVKDIEPVYIDMTPITNLIGTGELPGDIDMDAIVEAVLKEISSEHFATSEDLEKVSKSVSSLESRIDSLEDTDYSVYATKEETEDLSARIEALENSTPSGEWVTKEEFEAKSSSIESRINALEKFDHTVYATKEEVAGSVAQLEADYKAADSELSGRIEALEEFDHTVYATKEEVSNTYVSTEVYERDIISINSSIESKVSTEELNTLTERIDGLESIAGGNIDDIAQKVIDSEKLQDEFISEDELEEMIFTEGDIDRICVI